MNVNPLTTPSGRKEPCVTIGLPVYNGELHIRSAIDSILAQTFTDFELIIADNASTDRTEAICQDYAARDERVRYYRNKTNLGISRNFNRTFEIAEGKYFKWAAHDDVLAPEYLSRCVETLEANSNVVLCHSQVRIIDNAGHAIADYHFRRNHAGASRAHRRFSDVLSEDRWNFEFFGVVRSEAMKKTRLLDRYVGSDRVVRAELALLGTYYILPEPLFLNRDHPGRSVRALPAHHLRASLFDPSAAGQRVFPHWRILLEYSRCLKRVPLGPFERAACYASLARWLTRHHNWARLLVDLAIAVAPSSWEFFVRVSRSAESWLEGRVAKS